MKEYFHMIVFHDQIENYSLGMNLIVLPYFVEI